MIEWIGKKQSSYYENVVKWKLRLTIIWPIKVITSRKSVSNQNISIF